MILKFKDENGFWEFREILEFSYRNVAEEDIERAYHEVQARCVTEKMARTYRTIMDETYGSFAIMIYEEDNYITFHATNNEAYIINNEGKTIERIN